MKTAGNFSQITSKTNNLSMLRLLSSKAQESKTIWKPFKPCHVGMDLKACDEYYQMSTHLPGF